MDGQSCGNCRFARDDGNRITISGTTYSLNCRRYPPTITSASADTPDLFPLCEDDDWCGEWQPANPETVEQGAAVMARLVLLGDKAAAYALIDKLLESRD